MASKLTDELQSQVQRSGTNTGRMRTEAERASFATNVRKDIASIMYQLNVVYKELVGVLSSEQDLNALDYGLSGNVIFTHIRATAADATAYWSEDQVRARTIKETIDVLLAEIARLENEIQAALDSDVYDDAELRGLIQGNSLDLKQLAHDTMGPQYTLDGDGLPNLTYSISQILDAIGVFFAGYVASGNTYTSTYPALSLVVKLSEITIDTTLAQSVITGLPTDLGYIRDFIGMDTSGPEMPNYSGYGGSLNDISDGDSLEEAIWKLDQASSSVTIQGAYDAGGAGVAGVLQLLNAKGRISIKDDTGSPLVTLLEWIDTASAAVGVLRDTGIDLEPNRWLAFKQSGVDPAAVAGQGRLATRPDATSAKTELHYRSSAGADPITQVTRDGIVKELDIGHSTVRAADFQKYAADAGPSLDVYEMTDFVVQMLNFDSTTLEKVYSQIPIPQDEQGNRPTRVKFIGHFLLGPNGGGYPGGTGVAFEIATSDNVGIGVIAHKTLIDPGWQTPVVQFDNTLGAGQVDNLVVLEWPTTVLANNSLGVLNLRLNRDPANANDSWDDDCGLLMLHAIWYR